MAAFPREEIEEMVRRWLDAGKRGEAENDWKHVALLYTEDAEYSWNAGPNDDFIARGRHQIGDWALGTEMAGPILANRFSSMRRRERLWCFGR